MYDVQITLAGNVAKEPARRVTRDGTSVCSFRVAVSPRRYDRSAGEWADGNTMYFGVTCWRNLADNVHASVSKGDRVVLVGRLTRDSYIAKNGETIESWEISADSVSVDLTWATARPVRRPRAGATPSSDATAQAAETAAPVEPTVPEPRPVSSAA